jgi:hypothetical protein
VKQSLLLILFIAQSNFSLCQETIDHKLLLKRLDSLVESLKEYKELVRETINTDDKVSTLVYFHEQDSGSNVPRDSITYVIGILPQKLVCGFIGVYNVYYSIGKGQIVGVVEIKP